jgi:hypothetical protein
MSTTREVADELTRLAEALRKSPDLQIHAYLKISPAGNDKETFLRLASIAPRPLKKKATFAGESYEEFVLQNSFWNITIPRKSICVMIAPAIPAKYDCPAILSEIEMDAIGQ